MPHWLSKCDVGVLPIRRDQFLEHASPNKLSEYIIKGKPVIISRLKAIRYYFGEDALAYFEPNDPVSLAQQMIRVYRDKGLRARLAATLNRRSSDGCVSVASRRPSSAATTRLRNITCRSSPWNE